MCAGGAFVCVIGLPGNYSRQLPWHPGSVPRQQAANTHSDTHAHTKWVPHQHGIIISGLMPRFVSFQSASQASPGKLCLRRIQSGLYGDEMHLPRSKAEGAVEITGETMILKLAAKLCRMQPLLC